MGMLEILGMLGMLEMLKMLGMLGCLEEECIGLKKLGCIESEKHDCVKILRWPNDSKMSFKRPDTVGKE
jgi:hypothetical protein